MVALINAPRHTAVHLIPLVRNLPLRRSTYIRSVVWWYSDFHSLIPSVRYFITKPIVQVATLSKTTNKKNSQALSVLAKQRDLQGCTLLLA